MPPHRSFLGVTNQNSLKTSRVSLTVLTSYTQVTRGGEGLGGKAPFYLFRGMKVGNGTSRPGRTVWRFLKTLKTEFPHGCRGKP